MNLLLFQLKFHQFSFSQTFTASFPSTQHVEAPLNFFKAFFLFPAVHLNCFQSRCLNHSIWTPETVSFCHLNWNSDRPLEKSFSHRQFVYQVATKSSLGPFFLPLLQRQLSSSNRFFLLIKFAVGEGILCPKNNSIIIIHLFWHSNRPRPKPQSSFVIGIEKYFRGLQFDEFDWRTF